MKREDGDALLAQMQTPEAVAAMDEAFDASPEELGQAAVKLEGARGVSPSDRQAGRVKSESFESPRAPSLGE